MEVETKFRAHPSIEAGFITHVLRRTIEAGFANLLQNKLELRNYLRKTTRTESGQKNTDSGRKRNHHDICDIGETSR